MDENNPYNKDDISESNQLSATRKNDGTDNGGNQNVTGATCEKETKNIHHNKDDVNESKNVSNQLSNDDREKKPISNERKRLTVSEISTSYFSYIREEYKSKYTNENNLQKGKDLHEAIEYYFHLGTIPEGFENDIPFNQFLQFVEDRINNGYEFYPIFCEYDILDVENNISGRIDMLFDDPKDGRIIIVDWKRSSHDISKLLHNKGEGQLNSPENIGKNPFTMQLNLYKCIMEKKYNVNVSQMLIVQFDPNAKDYKIHEIEVIPSEEIQRRINSYEPSKPEVTKKSQCNKNGKARHPRADEMKQKALQRRDRARMIAEKRQDKCDT